MTTLILDAGALIALDRDDRNVWALLRVASDHDDAVSVPAGVIGQAWRDGSRQARLARALAHCEEVALTGGVARAAGLLCDRTQTTDVIDASVALLTAGESRSDQVALLTSDQRDMALLIDALGAEVEIVEV